MPPTDVCAQQHVQFLAAKRHVGRRCNRRALVVFHEKLVFALGRKAIYGIGPVTSDVEVAVRIERQAIGDCTRHFDDRLDQACAAVGTNFDAGNSGRVETDRDA